MTTTLSLAALAKHWSTGVKKIYSHYVNNDYDIKKMAAFSHLATGRMAEKLIWALKHTKINPLTTKPARLSLLFCIMPDDFTHQWGTPRSQWVNIFDEMLQVKCKMWLCIKKIWQKGWNRCLLIFIFILAINLQPFTAFWDIIMADICEKKIVLLRRMAN